MTRLLFVLALLAAASLAIIALFLRRFSLGALPDVEGSFEDAGW